MIGGFKMKSGNSSVSLTGLGQMDKTKLFKYSLYTVVGIGGWMLIRKISRKNLIEYNLPIIQQNIGGSRRKWRK